MKRNANNNTTAKMILPTVIDATAKALLKDLKTYFNYFDSVAPLNTGIKNNVLSALNSCINSGIASVAVSDGFRCLINGVDVTPRIMQDYLHVKDLITELFKGLNYSTVATTKQDITALTSFLCNVLNVHDDSEITPAQMEYKKTLYKNFCEVVGDICKSYTINSATMYQVSFIAEVTQYLINIVEIAYDDLAYMQETAATVAE